MKLQIDSKHAKYIKKKLLEIEGDVAVITGATAMNVLMLWKVTDTMIKQRDETYQRIEKSVYQIIKRVTQ